MVLLRYHILRTSNASWLSYAHDLGQAGLGAGRKAGRPCVLVTMMHEVSCRVLCDYAICIVRAGTYGLLDMADACRNHHFHVDYMHASALDVADACLNRHFITSTTT